MGPEIGRCAVRPEHFSDPSIRHYLAYIHGVMLLLCHHPPRQRHCRGLECWYTAQLPETGRLHLHC
jgi:hypothetical protein